MVKTDDYRPHPKPITKMERFASKWKDTRDINQNMIAFCNFLQDSRLHALATSVRGALKIAFTPDTLDTIRKLNHHIQLGCLSSRRWDKQNVRPHHHLNSLFTRSSLGLCTVNNCLQFSGKEARPCCNSANSLQPSP